MDDDQDEKCFCDKCVVERRKVAWKGVRGAIKGCEGRDQVVPVVLVLVVLVVVLVLLVLVLLVVLGLEVLVVLVVLQNEFDVFVVPACFTKSCKCSC